MENLILEIEDYVAGNIEGVENPDRMAFTVFLRSKLNEAYDLGFQSRNDEIKDLRQEINLS